MKSYEATAAIGATPEEIWAILTDAPSYPNWDSGVVRVEGRIAPGEKIKVVSKVNPGRAFPVKVSEFNPGRSMTWSGGMPLGLFKGVRRFTLTPEGDGTSSPCERNTRDCSFRSFGVRCPTSVPRSSSSHPD